MDCSVTSKQLWWLLQPFLLERVGVRTEEIQLKVLSSPLRQERWPIRSSLEWAPAPMFSEHFSKRVTWVTSTSPPVYLPSQDIFPKMTQPLALAVGSINSATMDPWLTVLNCSQVALANDAVGMATVSSAGTDLVETWEWGCLDQVPQELFCQAIEEFKLDMYIPSLDKQTRRLFYLQFSDASKGREYSDEDKLDLYLPTAAVTTSATTMKRGDSCLK